LYKGKRSGLVPNNNINNNNKKINTEKIGKYERKIRTYIRVRILGTGCYRWTHVMISRWSETEHYRCPLCFPLAGGGQGLSLGSYGLSGTLRDREGSISIER